MTKASGSDRALKLFRGIAVPNQQADAVIAQIVQHGMSGNEGQWKYKVPPVEAIRKKVDGFFRDPGFDRSSLFANASCPGVCACGESLGAVYYADRHNRSSANNHALVVEFSVPLNRVYVDCRDFLCAAFQLWDRESPKGLEAQRKDLADVFGAAVLRYFDRCVEDTQQDTRIAMCNLASFDGKVVTHHHANRNLIAGRYGTLFRSAFFVQGPVLGKEIHACRSPTAEEFAAVQSQTADNAHVSLNKFFSYAAG